MDYAAEKAKAMKAFTDERIKAEEYCREGAVLLIESGACSSTNPRKADALRQSGEAFTNAHLCCIRAADFMYDSLRLKALAKVKLED